MIHLDYPNNYNGSRVLCSIRYLVGDYSLTKETTNIGIVANITQSYKTSTRRYINFIDVDLMANDESYVLIKDYDGLIPIMIHADNLGITLDGALRIIPVSRTIVCVGNMYEFYEPPSSIKRKSCNRSRRTTPQDNVKYVW